MCLFAIEVGYEFNKEKLLEYNHMSFGGPPVIVETDEEANELLRNIQLESAIGNEYILTIASKLTVF